MVKGYLIILILLTVLVFIVLLYLENLEIGNLIALWLDFEELSKSLIMPLMLIITIFFKRGLSKGEYKLRKYPKMAKYIENKVKIDK